MTDGLFRRDLYHRLATAVLQVPPLRERGIADIAALSVHCLRRLGSQAELTKDAIERLAEYDWPGNVRELYSVLQGMAIELKPEQITASMIERALAERLPTRAAPVKESSLPPLAEVERDYVKRLAEASAGNVSLMTRISGKSMAWVRKRLAELGRS
jgi:DNA-binding NtrC family response regulator